MKTDILIILSLIIFDSTAQICNNTTDPACSPRALEATTQSPAAAIASPDPSVTLPACIGPGRFAASVCSQYYECTQVMWWWSPVLSTCQDGYAFDIPSSVCAVITIVDCQSRSTTTAVAVQTTTTAASVTGPTCTGAGRFPADSCYQYYECISVLWSWQAILKTCEIGYAFDTVVVECRLIAVVNCQGRLTTTVGITSSTTTATSVTVPTCTGAGRFAADSCYQYYECESVWFWWEPRLLTCQVGYAFDTIVVECRLIAVVDCQGRLTTTASPTKTTSTTTAISVTIPRCSGPGKHPAENCFQYYECESVWWWWQPRLISCEVGYAFDTVIVDCRLIAVVDCQDRLTTTVSTPTTTTVAPITVPSCSGPGKHPAESCYQFYECKSVWWWWEPRLQSCEIGYAFDTIVIDCRLVAVVDCQHRLTTTVAPPTTSVAPSPLPLPSCYGPNKFPAESCNQYYECVSVWWWWEPRLQTCEIGYAFDVLVVKCRLVAVVDCQGRLPTTVSTPTTTVAPLPPITVPTCSGSGKYPAESCYQYYECVSVWWWWESRLQTCQIGYAFDTILVDCRLVSVVDCQHRLTTTVTPPSTTSAPSPVPVPIPSCYGPNKFPAESCNEYYECVSVWWWWEPRLQTCEVGYAFDVLVVKCRLVAVVDCQGRLPTTSATPTTVAPLPPITVPACYGSARYQAESCYQYYECVPVLWWWEPRLQTCQIGYAFDIIVVECRPVAIVHCHHRLTTTVTPTTTLAPLPPLPVPSCYGPNKYPAESCYQYYECVSVGWWWEPRLQTCEVDHAFDILRVECRHRRFVNCQQRLTTTPKPKPTTVGPPPPPITVPSCSSSSKHEAAICYQYYECVQVWWWWQPELKTCPYGKSFDRILKACYPDHMVDCRHRITTHSPKPTTPKPTPPDINVEIPACYGPEKYPVGSCYDYYECVSVWWWWESKLRTCETGYAFDIVVRDCRLEAVVDCQHRITSPHPTTTTTIAPVTVPSCYSAGKYPTENCNEYYECVSVFWWWEPRLQTCKVDYAFDALLLECRLRRFVNCHHRLTTPSQPTTVAPLPPISVPTCSGSARYPAESCYNYYECVPVLWWWEPRLQTCQIGYAFDTIVVDCRPLAIVHCHHRLTTTVSPTTTLAPLPPLPVPSCYGPNKYPAENCNQYYECVSVGWWWEPRLQTCEVDHAFDILRVECRHRRFVNCQQRLTTTIKPKPTTVRPPPPLVSVPSCSSFDRHEAPICYQYYECVQVWWWWQPELKTCPPGKSFDRVLKVCYPDHIVDCHHRITTHAPKPTTPKPRPPDVVVVVPACYGPEKYPSGSCYDYYECVSVWWWWEPKLQTCETGYAFDIVIRDCRLEAVIDCQHRITSPRPTTSTTPIAPVTIPSCYSAAKYPTENCNQYYECVSVFWWWEPRLQTCKVGYAFDGLLLECRLRKFVDCHYRLTTPSQETTVASLPPLTEPSCYDSSRYPAPVCYQFYECVQVWWWWQPQIRTCPPGHAFDTSFKSCQPVHLVNCQNRLSTPRPRPNKPTPPMEHPLPPVVVPTTCDGSEKYRADFCYQYYECVSVWWWWEVQLKTCPDGDGFDHKKKKCICAELIGCRLPIKEPQCYGSGKYEAEKCNQYYECVRNLWSWTPELKSCPDGHGFDVVKEKCVKGFRCRPLIK